MKPKVKVKPKVNREFYHARLVATMYHFPSLGICSKQANKLLLLTTRYAHMNKHDQINEYALQQNLQLTGKLTHS